MESRLEDLDLDLDLDLEEVDPLDLLFDGREGLVPGGVPGGIWGGVMGRIPVRLGGGLEEIIGGGGLGLELGLEETGFGVGVSKKGVLGINDTVSLDLI